MLMKFTEWLNKATTGQLTPNRKTSSISGKIRLLGSGSAHTKLWHVFDSCINMEDACFLRLPAEKQPQMSVVQFQQTTANMLVMMSEKCKTTPHQIAFN